MGAWIEIKDKDEEDDEEEPSLPSWERGLKLSEAYIKSTGALVAPFVGAWIEMERKGVHRWVLVCHSLRGSVD